MDSETITVASSKRPSDMNPVLSDILSSIPAKLLIFIYLIYILISTDVFNQRILARFDDAVDEGTNLPTTWGHTIAGLFLVFLTAGVDALIKAGIV
jgi:hypothetical protein